MRVKLTQKGREHLARLIIKREEQCPAGWYRGLYEQIIEWDEQELLELGDWKKSLKGDTQNFKALGTWRLTFVKYPKVWRHETHDTFADGGFFFKTQLEELK